VCSSDEAFVGNSAVMRDRLSIIRFLLLTGAVLLMPAYCFAQSSPDQTQCEQIRQAVAQYGYVAARRHALETWGPEAVKFGDKCFTKSPGRRDQR
jgi:hypothetical protein